MSESGEDIQGALSIGAVSQATGIGVETLRMWERRYGAPQSIRLPSGHRRYPSSEVDRLRLVARALQVGFRAGDVAAASVEELREFLSKHRRNERAAGLPDQEAEAQECVANWIDAALRFDDTRLSEEFYREWTRLGPMRFVLERCVPFLERLGEDWRTGEISVSHEHFSSEKLGDFLAAQWRRLNERNLGAPLLVASPPGELHRLGMQMCCVMAALAERKIVYLGSQTPLREIVSAVPKFNPQAVCLSISVVLEAKFAANFLKELRAQIPPQISIIAGGRGAPCGLDGVMCVQSLEEFHQWARKSPA